MRLAHINQRYGARRWQALLPPLGVPHSFVMFEVHKGDAWSPPGLKRQGELEFRQCFAYFGYLAPQTQIRALPSIQVKSGAGPQEKGLL